MIWNEYWSTQISLSLRLCFCVDNSKLLLRLASHAVYGYLCVRWFWCCHFLIFSQMLNITSGLRKSQNEVKFKLQGGLKSPNPIVTLTNWFRLMIFSGFICIWFLYLPTLLLVPSDVYSDICRVVYVHASNCSELGSRNSLCKLLKSIHMHIKCILRLI